MRRYKKRTLENIENNTERLKFPNWHWGELADQYLNKLCLYPILLWIVISVIVHEINIKTILNLWIGRSNLPYRTYGPGPQLYHKQYLGTRSLATPEWNKYKTILNLLIGRSNLPYRTCRPGPQLHHKQYLWTRSLATPEWNKYKNNF